MNIIRKMKLRTGDSSCRTVFFNISSAACQLNKHSKGGWFCCRSTYLCGFSSRKVSLPNDSYKVNVHSKLLPLLYVEISKMSKTIIR